MKIVKKLEDIESFENKRVVLRLDLNVSIKEGKVTEDFRIKKSIPTIEYLSKRGAKIVIIAHLDSKEGTTLEPVANYLFKTFPRLRFVKDIFAPIAKSECEKMLPGDIVLFENLRTWKGEKENDSNFAKHLASFGDLYVNDAFSVSHRAHASVVGVPKYLSSCIGLQFKEEVKELSHAFNPKRPFLFILGGAKFETKIPLLKKFLPIADNIFIGGAIVNDFFKAEGNFIGDSLVSDDLKEVKEFLNNKEYLKKMIFPVDVRTGHKGFKYTKLPSQISVGEKIYDVGPKTTENLNMKIKEAGFVLWNGPMGNIEMGAVDGTIEIAKEIGESNARSVMGGGDTIAALDKTPYFEKFSFVSTGGGAMLDFLANETLPGLEAIETYTKGGSEKKSWLKRLFS